MHIVTKSKLQDFNFTFLVVPTGKKTTYTNSPSLSRQCKYAYFPFYPLKILYLPFSPFCLSSLSLVPFMNTLSFCSLSYSLITHSSRDLEDPKGILIICQWWSFSINSSKSNITFYRFFFFKKLFHFLCHFISCLVSEKIKKTCTLHFLAFSCIFSKWVFI